MAFFKKQYGYWLAAALLASCANTYLPNANNNVGAAEHRAESALFVGKINNLQSVQDVLDDFRNYQNALTALKAPDDAALMMYVQQAPQNALSMDILRRWLLSLEERNQQALFDKYYIQLPAEHRSADIQCAWARFRLAQNPEAQKLAQQSAATTTVLSPSCNRLIDAAAAEKRLPNTDVRRRILVLAAYNRLSDAASLTNYLPQDNAAALSLQTAISLITPKGRNRSDIEARFQQALRQQLTVVSDQRFVHGILGLSYGRDLNSAQALQHFAAADPALFNHDQWAWYARSALRLMRWHDLANIINAMPQTLKNRPVWQYWQGRSLWQLGQQQVAKNLWQQAAASGRNFYAVLAQEALGMPLTTITNWQASKEEANEVLEDAAIDHALVLFRTAKRDDDYDLRLAAQQQWRMAVRDYAEPKLIAAAKLAQNFHFHEMSIYSADRTNYLLNFELRYPLPFLDVIPPHANNVDLDIAWVYGLMRQESRFIVGAESRVGAQGLMQIMPNTAKIIAQKIGMANYDIHDTDTNVRMGTWYLADLLNRFDGQEVLASAAYNAGPSRARRWQSDVPLEGAIYTETIPFNETRDYVQKVMTNTIYYAHLLGDKKIRLTDKLGIINAGNSNNPN